MLNISPGPLLAKEPPLEIWQRQFIVNRLLVVFYLSSQDLMCIAASHEISAAYHSPATHAAFAAVFDVQSNPLTPAVRWLGLIQNCYLYYDLCLEMAKDY